MIEVKESDVQNVEIENVSNLDKSLKSLIHHTMVKIFFLLDTNFLKAYLPEM